MTSVTIRKRKRAVRRVFALLLVGIFILGIRIAWDAAFSVTQSSRQADAFRSSKPADVSHHSGHTSIYRIVIDPGHGGKDSGAKGASGDYEKDYNLSLALGVRELLERDPMFETKLTRSKDRFIGLEDRAGIANAWEADALVSIHGNTYENTSISGTETFYSDEHSLPLAKKLQEHVATALGSRDRGVKQEEHSVLSSAFMPAVIVESGYLTNPVEEKRLLSDEGLQVAAQAIFDGLKAYFEQKSSESDSTGELPVQPSVFSEGDRAKGNNQIHYNGSSKEGNRVALTFDDGPDQNATPKILDILKENDVKATFFLLGNRVKGNADMVRRISREGHAIGNHSWAHPNFNAISTQEAIDEIKRTQDVLEESIGYRPGLFRPPYGALKQDKLEQIANMGLTVVNWSVDTMDWSGVSSAEIMEQVREQLYPGGIVLQHSANGNGLENTIEALKIMIPELKEKGYEFVTVPELLQFEENE